MFETKSVSLRSYLLRVAMKKAKSSSGGNFSNYITSLISKDNEKEILEELVEEKKAIRDSVNFNEKQGDKYCVVCGEQLLLESIVCYGIFDNSTPRSIVHENCCRKKNVNFKY